MKHTTVLTAIDQLNKAREALCRGEMSIKQQYDLGWACWDAAWKLKHEYLDAVKGTPLAVEVPPD